MIDGEACVRSTIGEAQVGEWATALSGFDLDKRLVFVREDQRLYNEKKMRELADWKEQDFLDKDRAIYDRMNAVKVAEDKEAEVHERNHMQALKTRVIDDDDELVREPYQMRYLFLRSTRQMY